MTQQSPHSDSSSPPVTDSAAAAQPTRLRRSLIIMPAYNESGSVGHVVRSISEHLPEFDILVVDDGSSDHTAKCVPPPAKVISLPFNLGIGGAMQTGYRYAAKHGYERAIQVDADGQHPPEEIHRLVRKMDQTDADLVVGSRFLEAGSYEQTSTRFAGMVVLRTLLKLLTGKTFTDCTSGFRLANRHVIEAYARWYPDDYPEPEVLILLHRAGFAIEEVATPMKPRMAGESSIPLLKGLFYVAKVSIAILLDTQRSPWRHRSRLVVEGQA